MVSSPTDATRRLLDVAPLTGSSVGLLRDRPGLLKTLYDPAAVTGARLNLLRLNLLRLPLSATDFSQRPWTWRLRADGTARPTGPARDAASLARSIRTVRPGLRVVGTPRSAPAGMKTSGTVRGGGLADAALPSYADLLVAQRTRLRRHGVPLWAMTLGNEPGYSTDYASMTMTDARLVALADRVGPAIGSTRLWVLDHNWSDRDRVDAMLAGTSAFDGAAFHCYGGQPAQMAGLAVPRLVTECTGTADGAPGTFAWVAKNLVADAVAAGSSGLMMGNLAPDPSHGPVDPGAQWGCRRCRGPPTVSATGTAVREPEFFTLAHLARAAAPGGNVVGVDAPSWLSAAAFRNPDGSVGVGEMFSYRAPLT